MKADKTNHGDGTDAHKLLTAAETTAALSGRKVLLIFHASWCGPCFMLHRYLHDPQVKSIVDAHFVVQELDIWEHEKNGWENPGGVDIYKKYGGPDSVPFYVTLDPDGKKLGDSMRNGDNTGADFTFFLNTLKAADPRITDAELSTLRAQIKLASNF
jgi:thiol-disulfide isomerase/thioredoxin